MNPQCYTQTRKKGNCPYIKQTVTRQIHTLEAAMISGTGIFSKNLSHSKDKLPTLAAITGNTLWGFSFLLSKTALRYAPTYAFPLMNLMLISRIEHISLRGKKKLPLILLSLN